MLIDNFKPTCVQPGTKYEFEQIHDSPHEPLRHYVRCFSEVWISIPDMNVTEAVSMFIMGLRQECHNDLRKELLLCQPRSVEDHLVIAHEYAQVDDALCNYDEHSGPSRRFRRDDDRDRDRDCDDYRGTRRDDRRESWRDDRGDSRRGDRGGNRDDDDRPYKRGGRQDCNSGRRSRGNRGDNYGNALKGQKRDVDDAYDKVLCQDCPIHPGKGHTLGEC